MEMKTVIIISLTLGFIAGWMNDKSKENFYEKGSFLENTIPPLAIIFILYVFFQSISFGFMGILQLLLGMYSGNQTQRFIKRMRNK
jgi:hypothetical protein